MPNPIGLTMPFARTTSSLGYLAFSVTDLQATTHNLKALVLTNWGERPNHFYMGCNLIEFIFQPVTQETIDKVTARIMSQVDNWLPYVQINDVTVTFAEQDGHGMKIRIDFGLKSKQDLNTILEVVLEPQ
jgi:phage baseplate assembly protein W